MVGILDGWNCRPQSRRELRDCTTGRYLVDASGSPQSVRVVRDFDFLSFMEKRNETKGTRRLRRGAWPAYHFFLSPAKIMQPPPWVLE